MIKIYIDFIDVSQNLEFNSLSINESLNNRRNTANFKLINSNVKEGQDVKIYDGINILDNYSAGINQIQIGQYYQFSEKFKVGDKVLLGCQTENQEEIEILEIDGNLITLKNNTKYSHQVGELFGYLIFAGIIQGIPTEIIGQNQLLIYQINASDYSQAFDRQVVAETFQDLYAREIIGRIVYKFTSNDQKKIIYNFENLDELTYDGVAREPTLNDQDRISGNYSLNIGTTGIGIGSYIINLVSSIDFEDLDQIRLWLNFKNVSDKINSIKLQIGSSNINYFEWDNIKIDNNIWSYDNFDFKNVLIEGNPDKSQINYIKIIIDCNSSISLGDLKLDELSITKGGFTIKNVQRSDILFKDLRVQYKKPTVVLEDIAKNLQYFWYIDYNKDIWFFNKNSYTNNQEITDTSLNYDKLKISVDLTNLRNRQTIRGGMAPAENLYTQERICDGEEESWYLDYGPKDLKIYTDTGSGYIEKTVGVENLANESEVDYVFNFSEKVVRRASDSILPFGSKIKLEYFPYKNIRVRIQDSASISAMKAIVGGDGIFDGPVISDNNIRTFNEARLRAQAEIEAYKNPIITCSFQSEKQGFKVGELLRIQNNLREVDDLFLIQQIRSNLVAEKFVYQITAASTLFGYIEFFQLLFKKSDKISVDVNELVDIVLNLDEVVKFSDLYIMTKKDKIFYAMGNPGDTPNDAYADFSQTS